MGVRTPFGDLPHHWAAASRAEQHDYLSARLSRRGFLTAAGLAVAAPTLWRQSALASGSPAVTRHVGYGADPRRQAVVSFAAASSFRRAVVEYGTDRHFGTTVAADVNGVGGVATRYGHARLDALQPGTEYHYRVRLDGTVTQAGTLATAPRRPERFTFTAFGDQGVSADARAIVQQLVKVRPAFHLLAGDLCYADPSGSGAVTDRFTPQVWDEWLRMVEPVASGAPWMTAPGNHDMEPGFGPQGYDGYLGRFRLPGNGPPGCPAVYSFRYGNLAVICLDANDVSYEIQHNLNYSQGAQTAWLGRELETLRTPGSGIDFVVVVFHHCAYSTSTAHGSEGGVRAQWVPLFDRYEVDLVVNGHAHCYERTSQLRQGQVTRVVERSDRVDSRTGTTYITAGGGGASAEGAFLETGARLVLPDGSRHREDAPWSRPTRTQRHAFLAVEVTPATATSGEASMAIRVLDKTGLLLDDVTLLRPGTVVADTGASGGADDPLPWVAAAGAVAATGLGAAALHRQRQHRAEGVT